MSVNNTNYVRKLPLEAMPVQTAKAEPLNYNPVEQLAVAAKHHSLAGSASCSTAEPLNSAITQPVTVGVNIAWPAVIATRDMAYVLNCVKTGWVEGKDIRALILTIRGLRDSDMAKAMKSELPYFLGSHCEQRRSNSNVKSARFIIFDLDHVPDIEVTKQNALAKLPFLRCAFRSVRDGVKLVAELQTALTKESDYRLLWKYLALQVEQALQLKVDDTPDWCRACFFSFDPELLYNSAFKAVEVAKALQESEMLLELSERREPRLQQATQTKADPEVHAPSSLNSRDSDDDFTKARSVVQKLAQLQIGYKDWVRIGMALYAGFGERGRELWDIFMDNPHYQDTEHDLTKHWRSFASVHSITVSTLFFVGEKYGCQA